LQEIMDGYDLRTWNEQHHILGGHYANQIKIKGININELQCSVGWHNLGQDKF